MDGLFSPGAAGWSQTTHTGRGNTGADRLRHMPGSAGRFVYLVKGHCFVPLKWAHEVGSRYTMV